MGRVRDVKKMFQVTYDGMIMSTGFPTVTILVNGKAITGGGLMVREADKMTNEPKQ